MGAGKPFPHGRQAVSRKASCMESSYLTSGLTSYLWCDTKEDQKPQGSPSVTESTAGICAGLQRGNGGSGGQGEVITHPLRGPWEQESQHTLLSSLPRLSQSFSSWNLHASHVDLKMWIMTQMVRGGAWDSAFQAVLRWCWPCWPMDHCLSSKNPGFFRDFPSGSVSKGYACNAGDPGSIPGLGSLEKETVTHSSILAWEIPWTEEPGNLQSWGCKCQTWLSN